MRLEELGLTKEEVLDGVIRKISSDLLVKPIKAVDEDGSEYDSYEDTIYGKELRAQIRKRIDEAIENAIDKHIVPTIGEQINTIVLCPTNHWGETKGEPLSFVEYLTKRANEFMLEEVDFKGKTKKEDSWSSWKKYGTRIEYMIHEYLQYHIATWAKTALTEANKTIVEGLQKAVEIKLQEVLTKLQVSVKTER